MKIGDFDIEVESSPVQGGWTASALLPDGKKVISGPSSTEEGARHDVFLQAQARLYPQTKVEFTKRFESMDCKERAIIKHRADSLLEVIGRDIPPPHVNVDQDTAIEMAKKSGFTALEYAQRMNQHHPELLKAVTGTPYEPMYRRHFNLEQPDPFYSEGTPATLPRDPNAPAAKPKAKPSFRQRLARSLGFGESEIQRQADELLEAPMIEAEQVMVPYVDPKTKKQRMVPYVRAGKPKASQQKIGEADLGSPEERRALAGQIVDKAQARVDKLKAKGFKQHHFAKQLGKFMTRQNRLANMRRQGQPPPKAAFYPSDGGSAGGGGGITTA